MTPSGVTGIINPSGIKRTKNQVPPEKNDFPGALQKGFFENIIPELLFLYLFLARNVLL